MTFEPPFTADGGSPVDVFNLTNPAVTLAVVTQVSGFARSIFNVQSITYDMSAQTTASGSTLPNVGAAGDPVRVFPQSGGGAPFSAPVQTFAFPSTLTVDGLVDQPAPQIGDLAIILDGTAFPGPSPAPSTGAPVANVPSYSTASPNAFVFDMPTPGFAVGRIVTVAPPLPDDPVRAVITSVAAGDGSVTADPIGPPDSSPAPSFAGLPDGSALTVTSLASPTTAAPAVVFSAAAPNSLALGDTNGTNVGDYVLVHGRDGSGNGVTALVRVTMDDGSTLVFGDGQDPLPFGDGESVAATNVSSSSATVATFSGGNGFDMSAEAAESGDALQFLSDNVGPPLVRAIGLDSAGNIVDVVLGVVPPVSGSSFTSLQDPAPFDDPTTVALVDYNTFPPAPRAASTTPQIDGASPAGTSSLTLPAGADDGDVAVGDQLLLRGTDTSGDPVSVTVYVTSNDGAGNVTFFPAIPTLDTSLPVDLTNVSLTSATLASASGCPSIWLCRIWV